MRCPLDQAVLRAGDAWTFRQDGLSQILLLVDLQSTISSAAVFLLTMCFLFIAGRAAPEELTAENLRIRKRAFSNTVIMGGIVLVLAVATLNGFYHLAPAIMAPEDADPMSALAKTGSGYWEAVCTTVIIVLGAPAALSVLYDIRRTAIRECPRGSFSEQQEWRQRHGLAVDFRESLAPLVASLSPLLTAPALNTLSPAILGD